MIKGITLVRPASSPAVYDALVSFFSVLGFEDGKSWDDEAGRGRPFVAPLGNLEFVDGMKRAETDTFIEVTQLDAVRHVVEHWLAKHLSRAEAPKRISETAETHWKSRVFTIEPVPGISFAFWEWLDPLRGKPVALAALVLSIITSTVFGAPALGIPTTGRIPALAGWRFPFRAPTCAPGATCTARDFA